MSGRRKVVGYTSQYSVRNVRLLQSQNSISCEIKYTIGYISKYNLLLKKTKMGQDIGYRKISINNKYIYIVGSQIAAHTLMETGNGPNEPNTINL